MYSVVTDLYQPSPDRLRDWISSPKSNGYESLHTTVMSPTGKWVEVQIRTDRMDEIAEKGYAAHWKYKEKGAQEKESALDHWLGKIRESLENTDAGALDFIDDFKLNLFSDEIFVFTPNGELRKLPKDCTALDFAFDIHSQVGSHCLGAKVNNKLVPLSFRLKSGDQVEIITSKKQVPKEDWLKYVVTAKAKSKIKDLLKEEKKRISVEGKEILHKKLEQFKIPYSSDNITIIEKFFHEESTLELYFKIAKGKHNLNKIKELQITNGKLKLPEDAVKPAPKTEAHDEMLELLSKGKGKDKVIVLGDNNSSFDYKLSPCCNPIPGDKVFGFLTINEGIKIHRLNCPNAVQLMSNYAYRVIQAKWNGDNEVEFLAGVKFKGIDDIGLVHKITSTISNQMNINMRSISFESNDGIFEGKIVLYVNDTEHLQRLTTELKNISGIYSVERVEVE